MSDPIKLVTTKPDAELAVDLKKELEEASKPWLDACTKAHRAGFGVNCNFAPNYLGQYVIAQLQLVKTF